MFNLYFNLFPIYHPDKFLSVMSHFSIALNAWFHYLRSSVHTLGCMWKPHLLPLHYKFNMIFCTFGTGDWTDDLVLASAYAAKLNPRPIWLHFHFWWFEEKLQREKTFIVTWFRSRKFGVLSHQCSLSKQSSNKIRGLCSIKCQYFSCYVLCCSQNK